MTHPKVEALLKQGQSIWQDDIARSMLISGKLAGTIRDIGVRGLTSNPTIFEKAISSGTDYDAQISELLNNGKSAGEIFEAVEVQDLQNALDSLIAGKPVAVKTTNAFGCSIKRVS